MATKSSAKLTSFDNFCKYTNNKPNKQEQPKYSYITFYQGLQGNTNNSNTKTHADLDSTTYKTKMQILEKRN